MARATRNTANGFADKKPDIENESPTEAALPTKAAKAALNKKRKRTSDIEPADTPSPKQSRSDESEDIPMADDKTEVHDTPDSRYPAFAGDIPLKDDDAQKILDILDVADEQGLLDRVFPLDDVLGVEPSTIPSSSKSPSDSYSLRVLLKESAQHPLRVLKSAIKQLYPISSQPRSKVSPPAQQQRRFCELALSLVDQASKHTLDGLTLSPDLVLPEHKPKADDDDEEDATGKRRKYALVQRLPTGDLWTSLNLEHVGSDSKPLVDSEMGYAELVAVLPSASSSKSPPTLGNLHADKLVTNRHKPITSQRISCGSFLNYGPYASFAPSFDSDSGDLGFNAVSSVFWRRHEKGKAREKARILGERMRQKLAQQASESMEVDGVEAIDPTETEEKERERRKEAQKALVEKVFGEEDASEVLAVFDALEREENISELVRRNGEAIHRMALLQQDRFRSARAHGTIDPSERELARKVMDSLTLLASLRPRSGDESESSIIPPVSTLRKLQRQLPAEASSGWYGTLSDDRSFALRDDTTLNVQNVPDAPIQTPATTAAQAPAPPPTTPSYASFPFSSFPQNYRTTYSSQAAATRTASRTQSTYQASPFNQSAYAQWLTSQTQLGSASQAGTPARHGTPQPALSSTFFPYGAGAGAGSTPTRAVSNTLVGRLQAAVGMATPPGGASAGGGLALPAHMRQQASMGSPLGYGGFP